MKEGDDDGFLWRLNTYWSFVEVPGGLLIECEAISLTRDVPARTGLAGRSRHSRHAPRLPEIHIYRHAKCAEFQHLERSTSMNHECEAHMQEAMIADRRQVGFVNPLRVHKALTADIEKRALVWMAERTPSWPLTQII